MDGRTAAAVLGITQGATRDEIRRAFRARAKIVHPDAHGTDEAFVALRAAADLLLATAPERPSRRPVAADDEARAEAMLCPPAPIATDTPAASPSAPAGGAVGRRTGRWVQQPAARPGAAIDLTDRPAELRRPPAPTARPAEGAAAFARVLDAQLARR